MGKGNGNSQATIAEKRSSLLFLTLSGESCRWIKGKIEVSRAHPGDFIAKASKTAIAKKVAIVETSWHYAGDFNGS